MARRHPRPSLSRRQKEEEGKTPATRQNEDDPTTTSKGRKTTTRVSATLGGASVVDVPTDTETTSTPTLTEAPASTSSQSQSTGTVSGAATESSSSGAASGGTNKVVLIAAIAGGAVVVLGLLIWFCVYRRKKKRLDGNEKKNKRDTTGSELWGGNYNGGSLYLPNSRLERRRTSAMLPDEDDTKLEMEERPPFNSYSVSPPPPPSAFTFPPKRPAENPQVLHLPPASPLTAAQFSADPFMDPNPFSLATPSPNRSSFARSTNRVRSPVSMASSITAASSADEDPFRDDDDDDRRDPRKDTLYGITNAYAGTDEPEPVPIAPLSVSSHRPPSPIDSKKGALNSDTNPPSGRAPVTVNYSRPGRPLVASHDDTGSNDARPLSSVDDIIDTFAGYNKPKSAGALKEDMSTYTSSKGIIDNNPPSSSTKTFVPDQSSLTRDPNVGAPVIRIQDADRPEEWQPLQSLGVQHSPNYRSPTLSVYERYNEAEPVPTVR